jgi:hypothetical protein
MKPKLVVRAAVGPLAMMALPGVALAQPMPGSEIIGQPLQVTSNGVTNTVYLDPGGTARILTPSGNAIPGNWTMPNGQLCLSAAGAQECWPYTAPFQAGQPVTLASSCNQSSTWLATATNAPTPPPRQGSERGK